MNNLHDLTSVITEHLADEHEHNCDNHSTETENNTSATTHIPNSDSDPIPVTATEDTHAQHNAHHLVQNHNTTNTSEPVFTSIDLPNNTSLRHSQRATKAPAYLTDYQCNIVKHWCGLVAHAHIAASKDHTLNNYHEPQSFKETASLPQWRSQQNLGNSPLTQREEGNRMQVGLQN